MCKAGTILYSVINICRHFACTSEMWQLTNNCMLFASLQPKSLMISPLHKSFFQ
jgi:hypothetical protein